MDKIATALFAIIGIIVFTAGIGLLLAFPIKWCWNYTMPYLFEWKTITWGQAWCLYFIAQCLNKSTQANNND